MFNNENIKFLQFNSWNTNGNRSFWDKKLNWLLLNVDYKSTIQGKEQTYFLYIFITFHFRGGRPMKTIMAIL
jgi:hypothetical protein